MGTERKRCPWSVSSIIRELSQSLGMGGAGWWGGGGISAHVHTHTHTWVTWHTVQWGVRQKPMSARNRYQQEPACTFVLYLSVIAASAVSVCLYLGVYAVGRRQESKLKLSDRSQGCVVWKRSMSA